MKNVYRDEEIITALKKSRGRVAQAAQVLGCSRNTIKNRLEGSEFLREVRSEILTSSIDDIEDELYLMCMGKGARIGESDERGQVPENVRQKAIGTYLSARAKGRGYGVKGQSKIEDGSMQKREWMFQQLDVLADAIEKGGPPILN
jgi:Bacterial regulatory protein, Fis family